MPTFLGQVPKRSNGADCKSAGLVPSKVRTLPCPPYNTPPTGGVLYFILMPSMYILFSPQHQRHYIGSTASLKARFLQHQKGLVRSTKKYCPWELIHHEDFATRGEAQKREYQVKSYKGGEAFKKLVWEARIKRALRSKGPASGGVPPEAG